MNDSIDFFKKSAEKKFKQWPPYAQAALKVAMEINDIIKHYSKNPGDLIIDEGKTLEDAMLGIILDRTKEIMSEVLGIE